MKWGQLCLVSKDSVKTHTIYNSEFVLTIQNEGVNVWEVYNDDDSYLNITTMLNVRLLYSSVRMCCQHCRMGYGIVGNMYLKM